MSLLFLIRISIFAYSLVNLNANIIKRNTNEQQNGKSYITYSQNLKKKDEFFTSSYYPSDSCKSMLLRTGHRIPLL